MIRLPDSNYTDKLLDGTQEQTGFKQLTPAFSQGTDVDLRFTLQYNGKPISITDWDLKAIVKKNVYAVNILWLAPLGTGLYNQEDNLGVFRLIMPAEISSLFLPGTYFLEVRGKQKVGKLDSHKDLTVTLMTAAFSIELSPGSPNPTLHATSNREVSFNPETGYTLTTYTNVEPTMPAPVDTTKA